MTGCSSYGHKEQNGPGGFRFHLAWVSVLHVNWHWSLSLHLCFIKLTNNHSLTADDSTPDAPVPDGGARSTDDPDVAATSSDSESSFSDWHLPLPHCKASLRRPLTSLCELQACARTRTQKVQMSVPGNVSGLISVWMNWKGRSDLLDTRFYSSLAFLINNCCFQLRENNLPLW